MKKNKIRLLIFSLLIIFAIVYSNISMSANSIDLIKTEYPITEGVFDSYTDRKEFNHNGTRFTLDDYRNSLLQVQAGRTPTKSLYKSTSNITKKSISIQGDDPITQIIPRELFVRRGSYLYIGKEYGFYVYTFWNKGTNYKNNSSIVLVFKIENDNKLIDSSSRKSELSYKIIPYFQTDFVTLNRDETSFEVAIHNEGNQRSKDLTYSMWGIENTHTLNYSLPSNLESVVIPTVQRANSFLSYDLDYVSFNRFLIGDVSFKGALLNSQEKNEALDLDYKIDEDNGSFFIGTNYKPYGHGWEDMYQPNKPTLLSVGVSFIFGKIKYIGTILEIGDLLKDINEVYDESDTVNINKNQNDVAQSQLFYNKKYGNDGQVTQYGTLLKSAEIQYDPNNTVYYSTKTSIDDPDDYYVQGGFTVSEHAPTADHISWATNFYRNIKLSIFNSNYIYQGYFPKVATAESTYKIRIRYEADKVLSIDKPVHAYNLKNEKNMYEFTAPYTGYYTFSVTNSNAKIDDLYEGQSYRLDNNGTYKYVAGETVYFNIWVDSNKMSNSFYVTISPAKLIENTPSTERRTVGETETIRKFVPATDNMYKISLLYESSIAHQYKDITIYNQNFEVIKKINDGSSSSLAYNHDKSDNVNVYLEKGKIYYIVAKYPATSNEMQILVERISNNFIEYKPYSNQNNNALIGDYSEGFIIKNPSIYTINFEYNSNNGLINPEMHYYIMIIKANNVISVYSVPVMVNNETIEWNDYYFGVNDKIYIGYINAGQIGTISINITETPTQRFYLQTDPFWADDSCPVGTEVSLNGKGYYGTSIATGFTRIVYFQGQAPLPSRLDYTWTSTNTKVATVSQYGTIKALSSGNTTIRVSRMMNINGKIEYYLATIDITVYETSDSTVRTVQLTTDANEDTTLNGTEYKYLNGKQGETTIHVGYTRSICIISGPTNIRQDYYWTSSDYTVATVNEYGIVIARRPGTVTIRCQNKYADGTFIGEITLFVI